MQKNRARALALTGLFAVALLTGCTLTASDVGPMTQVTPFEQAATLSQPAYGAPYVIATGDQITVRFYYNPQLDEDVTVRPDGNISLSLVGDMPANGKTPDQLSKEITDKYADYLTKPVAVVLIRVSALARVFVSGEISRPGVVSLNNGFDTVLQSIASSGGILETADLGHVILIRHVPSQAEPIVVQLDLARAIGGKTPQQDMLLLPNDFVYVPRSGAASLAAAMRLYIFDQLNLATAVTAGTTFPSPGPR
jgi:polysaccharide biosynthesis/export protein